MRNLAGNKYSDLIALEELTNAGISPFLTSRYGEVETIIEGRLGNWEFRRAWYYWIASSPTGLRIEHAEALHRLAGQDVRVAGHCGCPAPEDPWLKHIDPAGRKIIVDPDGSEKEKWLALIDVLGDPPNLEDYIFTSSLDVVSHTSYIDLYHVDTQDGLSMLVKVILIQMKNDLATRIN